MISVTFITADGAAETLNVEPRGSLMEAGVLNDIAGIEAECGGNLLCATCHVYIGEDWLARLEPPGEAELELLSGAAQLQKNSRLSCQVRLTEQLDGLVALVAPGQR